MRQDDNPKALFDQMSTIKFKHERDDDPGTVMPDAKFTPRLVTVVAEQHKPVTASLISRKERENAQVTIKDLKDDLDVQWRLMGGHKRTTNNNKEVTLVSFDGKCHKCGIQGHMAKDCRVKDHKKVGKHKSKRKSAPKPNTTD